MAVLDLKPEVNSAGRRVLTLYFPSLLNSLLALAKKHCMKPPLGVLKNSFSVFSKTQRIVFVAKTQCHMFAVFQNFLLTLSKQCFFVVFFSSLLGWFLSPWHLYSKHSMLKGLHFFLVFFPPLDFSIRKKKQKTKYMTE